MGKHAGERRGRRLSRREAQEAYDNLKARHEILKAKHEILKDQYRQLDKDFQEIFTRLMEQDFPEPVSRQTTWGATNESVIETDELPVLPSITVVQSEGLDEAKAFALRRRNGLLNHAAGDWS